MKNVVVCVDLNEDSVNVLKDLGKKIDLLKDTKVHLIHAFEIHMGAMEFASFIYPIPEQYPEIESSVLGILDNLARDLGLSPNQIEKHCIFSHSKEQTVREYLEDKKADLVVISTRGKHGIEGFFASSLADFLCKYSPCDILVMRPPLK